MIERRTFLGGVLALENGRWFDANKPTFLCQGCGTECETAPDPPERAWCPKCCPDHDYDYDRSDRRWECKHCGELRPDDWDDGL